MANLAIVATIGAFAAMLAEGRGRLLAAAVLSAPRRDPRLQLMATSRAHDGGEGTDVAGQRGQLGVGGEDGDPSANEIDIERHFATALDAWRAYLTQPNAT